ncbi:hypothetical protein C1645_817796 [Glomus cerebriforme]|uniref:Uncharacterized protein n=1 Tax=Glomus cerebriforme TaxID=658196 RepID=A0A397T8I7_9GLOM|nr:hypothetical protein C1645_817796 [Glomus cerebriforme]
MKCKARSLFSENLENNTPINSGILVSSNGLFMTPKLIQALIYEYKNKENFKSKVLNLIQESNIGISIYPYQYKLEVCSGEIRSIRHLFLNGLDNPD